MEGTRIDAADVLVVGLGSRSGGIVSEVGEGALFGVFVVDGEDIGFAFGGTGTSGGGASLRLRLRKEGTELRGKG